MMMVIYIWEIIKVFNLYNEKIDDFDKIFGIENGLIDEKCL